MPKFELTGRLNGVRIKPTVLTAPDYETALAKVKSRGIEIDSLTRIGDDEEEFRPSSVPPPLPDAPAKGGWERPPGTTEGGRAQETRVWFGRPSQVTNIASMVIGVIFSLLMFVMATIAGPPAFFVGLAPLLIVGWKMARTHFTTFEITTQRLRVSRGVLFVRKEDIELYRVRDTILSRSLFERIFGLGTVHLKSADVSTPNEWLNSIPDSETVREELRTLVEEARRKMRTQVREIG